MSEVRLDDKPSVGHDILQGGGQNAGDINYDGDVLVSRVAQLSEQGTQEDKLRESLSLGARRLGLIEDELVESVSLAPGLWGAQESELSDSLSMALRTHE